MFEYKEVKYEECEEVYPPAEDTFLLIDNLLIKDDMEVLEIGGGCGLVSIHASLNVKSVDVTDINPYAIKCIEHNIKLNNRDNIHIIRSNLFDNINKQYDLILFNTPYLPVDDEEHVDDEYSKAWDGGRDGREVIDKFLEEAVNYLKKDGLIQLVQSSFSNNQKTLDYFNNNGYTAEITDSIHMFFEDITLITAYKN